MSNDLPTRATHLYAELLPNIRRVSVSVSLTSPADSASTVVEVLQEDDNGVKEKCGKRGRGATRLRVRHAGAVQEMILPGQVAVASGTRLPLPHASAPASYLTWRLPLAGDAAPPGCGPASADDLLAPWSAPDLQPRSRVVCRRCDAIVVPQGRIAVWKDLPSDNWAEMMEFWHCHKPDHAGHSGNGKAGDADLVHRGYGANSVITAEPGVGYVDLIAFVFSEGDVRGLLFSQSTAEKALANREDAAAGSSPATEPQGLNVFCASCRAQIGFFNPRMQSVSLFQWQVGCASTTTAGPVAPSISDCVAAMLMASVARTGSSKSVILPIYETAEAGQVQEADDVLQVWVLNSSICYASSGREAQTPTLAIKLLYKRIPRAEADSLLEKLSSDVQEINLPAETIEAVAAQLEASNGLLPSRERAFKEWKIGLVDRWDPGGGGGRGQ